MEFKTEESSISIVKGVLSDKKHCIHEESISTVLEKPVI